MRRARASRTWAVAMRRSGLLVTTWATSAFKRGSLNPSHQVTEAGAGAMFVWLPLEKAALTSVFGGWKFGPTAQPFRNMAEETPSSSIASVAAPLQKRHGDGKQYEGHQEGTALLEVDRHRATGDGGRQAAIKPAGAPPDHQPHEPAEDDEDRGAHQHQAGES